MITINGRQIDSPVENQSLSDCLDAQGYKADFVAVERNGVIVQRNEYQSVILKDGDVLEVLHFVGGGQSAGARAQRDLLTLGGHAFTSRFILGSGKFSLDLVKAAVEHAGAQIVTLALRRANPGGADNILDYVPEGVTLLPNTSGARNADEAVRIARLSRELGCGDFVKIEVIRDSKYLLPDNRETVKATETLAGEGFVVMPYMFPDLCAARDLVNAGAACVMPLAAPIGSNRGLCARDFIQILIDEIDVPIIVDAGIGKPSQACEAMEMGADAIMANTAIATAKDIPAMAEAFKKAVDAGRTAWLSGLRRVLERGADPSSPLTGFLSGEREAV
ncbi:MAG: sulfur carrier protein ThiS [Synergistaceae bacterium]|nr:sulfur carrier protein ThiS [Synergistaceae bacterium]